VNERVVLPTAEYSPTSTLPAHLSPFVDDEKEGYKPKRREQLDKIKESLEKGASLWNDDEEDSESEGEEEPEIDLEERYQTELKAEMEGKSFETLQKEKMDTEKPKKKKVGEKRKNEEETEQLGSEMMLSRKKRWLFNRMTEKIQHQKDKAELLMTKRRKIEQEEKTEKTKKAETPKKEMPKKEAPKKETPKKETPKKETPIKETPIKETTKKETPKKEETPKKAPRTPKAAKPVSTPSREQPKRAVKKV